MRIPILLAIVALSSLAIAVDQTIGNRTFPICDPPSGRLYFTNNNTADMSDCLINSPGKQDYSELLIDTFFRGELVVPIIKVVHRVSFHGVDGSDNTGTKPVNVSRINMPDLQNVTSLSIYNMANLSSLEVPRLKYLEGGLFLDLRGGPAISLSFPQLERAGTIRILGKIDSIDLPRLNKSSEVNVTSTGRLNCTEFAARVVNATPSDYIYGRNNSICVSPQGSIIADSSNSSGTMIEANRCFALIWTALVGSMMMVFL